MYEQFFGLDEAPFRLTPDPRYLFLSEKHREALGHLVYGIREGAGFIAITGEIGAGKTTLLRSLLGRADDSTRYAYVLNPVLTGVELLQEINHELGLPAQDSRRELLSALNRYLVEQKQAGRSVVLVVDEAQTLDGAILEQLRMLSNFETETGKLIQIVLVGQPELRDLLARPELAQLNQRITVRWHLGSLDRRETSQYVAHRISVACSGRTPRPLFTAAAHRRIFAESRGVPRLINILCHRALLVAFAHDRSRVDWRSVRRAVAENRGPLEAGRAAKQRRSWVGAAVAATLALGIAAGAYALWPRAKGPDGDSSTKSALPAGETASAPASAAPEAARVAAGEATAPQSVEVVAAAAGGEEAISVDDGSIPPPQVAAATGTLTNPAAADRAGLDEALRQTTAGQSAYEATEALLRAWQVQPLSAAEASASALDLPSIAGKRGLRYLPVKGNLTMLRTLDLPAILEVSATDAPGVRFVAVSSLDDESAHVTVGRSQIELAPPVLGERWYGRAHLLWRDVDQIGEKVMKVGTRGRSVARLHDLLRAAQSYQGPPSEVFTANTAQAVTDFQQREQLVADGKVGPLTMIALYRTVGSSGVPRLRTRDDGIARGGAAGEVLSALPGRGD